MSNDRRENPLSIRSLLAFLGVNLTLGSLLSLVANIVQLLTVVNGVVIFISVFAVSTLYLVQQVRAFQQAQQKTLMEYQESNQELRKRLDRIQVALKIRMNGNPRPDEVVKWVNVKKILAMNVAIQIKEILEDSVILDKGGKDGLVEKIPCKLTKKGMTLSLEESEIYWVDPNSHQSIVKHKGANLRKGDNPQYYSIELITPSITPTEKFIGNVLLIAEGLEPDWS